MIPIEKQRIICDMDGVLTDSVAAVVSCYNEDFQFYSDFKEIRSCDIHTYDFQELALASKEYVEIGRAHV